MIHIVLLNLELQLVAENWPEEIIETFQANIDETYMNFTTQTSKDRDIPLERF